MRPLRSLMLGDTDHYLSPYIFGVAQGMKRLGHVHVEVSIRQPIEIIAAQIEEARPDLLWTHMLLWPPSGAPRVEQLVDMVSAAAYSGARVILHDGDAKERTRHPHDVSDWCALALVNHAFDRSAWKVPALRWPYFAGVQDAIAAPVDELRCGLFFAGTLSDAPMYSARTALLHRLIERGVDLRLSQGANTLPITASIAASAEAVLGFGRPEIPGWVDTRVFQYPGAGAILLHDDVGGYLEPWVHYVPYRSGDADSIVDALDRLRALTDASRWFMRRRAFDHVQRNHSAVPRALQVLKAVDLT